MSRRGLGSVDADHFQASIEASQNAIDQAERGNCRRAVGTLAFAWQYAGAAHEQIAAHRGESSAEARALRGPATKLRKQALEVVERRCIRGASGHDTTKPMFGRGRR